MPALDARINMIKQQLRTWQVTDEHLIALIEALPRERFVPTAYQNLAYADYAIPLNEQQTLLPPKIVGRALQILAIQPDEIVLEIGTGTGYITALLAQLAKHVYSVDIDPAMTDIASNNLAELSYPNITLEVGDAHAGWDKHALYDCIFVTGSYPVDVPDTLKEQVKVGGRIFAFIGTGSTMHAQCYTRRQKGWDVQSFFETHVTALVHAQQPKPFKF